MKLSFPYAPIYVRSSCQHLLLVFFAFVTYYFPFTIWLVSNVEVVKTGEFDNESKWVQIKTGYLYLGQNKTESYLTDQHFFSVL